MSKTGDWHHKSMIDCEECGKEFEHYARRNGGTAKRFCDACASKRIKSKHDKVRRMHEEGND